MAATAASFTSAAFEPTDREESPSSKDSFGKDPDLEWVLPSEVDALGRSVEFVPLFVTIRRGLSLTSIRAYITRLRRPPF